MNEDKKEIKVLIVGSGSSMAIIAARAIIMESLPMARVIMVDAQEKELSDSLLKLSESLKISNDKVMLFENKLEELDRIEYIGGPIKPKKNRMSRIEKDAMYGGKR